ncbi:MAG: GntR family transcriptional regulator [Syntrophobacteraceae bacterium]
MISKISDKIYVSDSLFQALRDRIVSGVYPPGSVLSEKDLTEEFKVSRTPYREAIRKLEDMKLVTVVPRFGTYVREVNLTEIMDAYEVRLRLEAMAVELAAQRRTEKDLEEFEIIIHEVKRWQETDESKLDASLDVSLHDCICRASRNLVLMETLFNLRLICGRVWTSVWWENYDFKQLGSHWITIYEALRDRDPARAGAAMTNHIQDAIDLVKKSIFSSAWTADTAPNVTARRDY